MVRKEGSGEEHKCLWRRNSKRKGKKGDKKIKRRLEKGTYIISSAEELRQTVLTSLSIFFDLHFHFWSQTLLE